MVLVLIFLIIFIIITLFLFLVTASNLRFSLENLEVSNTKKKFNIKISLVLFKKFRWLFINLDKTKLEKIAKKVHLDKNILKKLDKDSIRGNITIISQNPYIFNMSIKINMIF